MVGQRPDDRHGERDGEGRPDDLLVRAAIGAETTRGEVEAVDHDEPEPVEGRRDRQQHRIGVGRLPPQHQVDDHREDDEATGHGDDVGGNAAVAVEVDGHPGEQDDRDRDDEQDELDPAPGPWGEWLDGGPHRATPEAGTVVGAVVGAVVGGVVGGVVGRWGRGWASRPGCCHTAPRRRRARDIAPPRHEAGRPWPARRQGQPPGWSARPTPGRRRGARTR